MKKIISTFALACLVLPTLGMRKVRSCSCQSLHIWRIKPPSR